MTHFRRLKRVLLAGLLAAATVPPGGALAAAPVTVTVPTLTRQWAGGAIADDPGLSRTLTLDLDQDGTTEVVNCSNGHVVVLHRLPSGSYAPAWFSPGLGCRRLAAADRDADGITELFVATGSGRILILDGHTYQTLAAIVVPGVQLIRDVIVGNVDQDAELEVVVVNWTATLVFSASTLALEWTAAGMAGDRVELGDVDGDGVVEIVVGGYNFQVLSAVAQQREWTYSAGNFREMAVGDIDSDGRAEIAWTNSSALKVLDGDSRTVKWQRTDLWDATALTIANIDLTGAPELLVAYYQSSSVTALQGGDGATLWSINPLLVANGSGYGISVGDADGDGDNEVVWGAGTNSTSRDRLLIADWQTQTLAWLSDDVDGPIYTAIADLDLDGSQELIVASFSTNGGYSDGVIKVYDGATHLPKWEIASGEFGRFDFYDLAVGQVDADPALEIVVTAEWAYNTHLLTFDGIAHALEWESPSIGAYVPRALVVANLDGDALDEIVIGLDNNHVQVFNGASAVIQWEGSAWGGVVQDVAVGDLYGDGTRDLVVLTDSVLQVYDPAVVQPLVDRPVAGGLSVAVANRDLSGAGEVLVATYASGVGAVESWEGPTFSAVQRRLVGDLQLLELAPVDLDSDGVQEFVALGYQPVQSYPITTGFVGVGNFEHRTFWEYQRLGDSDVLRTFAQGDIDGDGQAEVALGGDYAFEVNALGTQTAQISYVTLPLLRK